MGKSPGGARLQSGTRYCQGSSHAIYTCCSRRAGQDRGRLGAGRTLASPQRSPVDQRRRGTQAADGGAGDTFATGVHEHIMSSPPAPLIVSVKFDDHTFGVLNELRRRYFPPARNVVPAHITLFHALPGAHEDRITSTVRLHCANTSVLPLRFSALRSLGRGVAIEVACPGLLRVRDDLATAWSELLGAQDRQAYRPHVTIQNKVTSTEAKQVYDQLSATWLPFGGQGKGLMVWRYLGGPWELVDEFVFSAPTGPQA